MVGNYQHRLGVQIFTGLIYSGWLGPLVGPKGVVAYQWSKGCEVKAQCSGMSWCCPVWQYQQWWLSTFGFCLSV